MPFSDKEQLRDKYGNLVQNQAYDPLSDAFIVAPPATGLYSTTLPTLTNGQSSAVSLGSRGQSLATLTDSSGTNMATVTTGLADGAGTGTPGLGTHSFGRVYNGTSWDRQRGSAKGSYVVGSPLAVTSPSGTVGTAAAQLLAANTTRVLLQIFNDTAADVWVNFTGTAAATPGGGNIKIAAGASRTWSTGAVPTNAVSAIASAAATAVTVLEA